MEPYVYLSCTGDEAFLAGKMSLLAYQYQHELEDYEMGDFEFAMDAYKCESLDELEIKIKERFFTINKNEYSIGSSIEEERKSIDEIKLKIEEKKMNLDDLFYKMFSSHTQKRFLKSLKDLSFTFAREMIDVLETGEFIRIYSIKGLQNNDYYHAYDYVDQLLDAYALVYENYVILVISGVSD